MRRLPDAAFVPASRRNRVEKEYAPMSRGLPPEQLSDEDLLREMGQLHEHRNDTLRHGSSDAVSAMIERTAELEKEYLRRFPEREVDPGRTRAGARARTED